MGQPFDPDFGTALDAAAAIRAKNVSSVELTEHTLRRIEAFQPALNAYVYQLRDEALAAAARADEAIARGTATGALHGVPINVKESFGVEGRPCTWGIPPLASTKAPANATAVRRLLDAGAVLLGATNVPFELMDGQSFNDIYGTSNNPWDLTRTPGGSSGGSAASLAAGMAFFSIGSDIGGSIRGAGLVLRRSTATSPRSISSASWDTRPAAAATFPASRRCWQWPGRWRAAPTISRPDCGVLGGPGAAGVEGACSGRSRPAVTGALRDFRIGYVLDDPAAPVSAETRAVLESAIRACERAGATMKTGLARRLSLSGAARHVLLPSSARSC